MPGPVLVLGDSLAFPRASAGQAVDDAWPQQLVRHGVATHLWLRSSARATSADVLREATELRAYLGGTRSFAATVVQVGIVDVSPRVLPYQLQRALDLWPHLNGLVLRATRRAAPRRAWIGLDRYTENVGATLDIVRDFSARTVVVEIVEPGPSLVEKLGDFSHDVRAYNDRLRELVAARDEAATVGLPAVSGDAETHLLPDGHHLSTVGHDRLARAIAELLR